MTIKEARMLPEAAADALDALAHLVVFATAEGHEKFAATAMDCLQRLIVAPDARRIVPAEYFDLDIGARTGL